MLWQAKVVDGIDVGGCEALESIWMRAENWSSFDQTDSMRLTPH